MSGTRTASPNGVPDTPPDIAPPPLPRAGGWPSPTAVKGPLDAVLVGVPLVTASGATAGSGMLSAPAAVRAALQGFGTAVLRTATLVAHGASAPFDLDEALRIADDGDMTDAARPPGGASIRQRAVRERVADLHARARLVVALGGDRAVTVPVVRGAAVSGAVLLSPGLAGVRRIAESGMNPRRIVVVGAADFTSSAAGLRRAAEAGITVIPLSDVRDDGAAAAMKRALRIAGADDPRPHADDGIHGGVHVSADLAVCDGSVAPAAPGALPGGLAAHELRALLRHAASDPRLVTADVIGVDADADAADARTVRLAALCVLELLTGLAVRT